MDRQALLEVRKREVGTEAAEEEASEQDGYLRMLQREERLAREKER